MAWFGGKSRVAPTAWERFGDVPNYVEPFFGSGAVLLGRPQPFRGTETVNDKDGFLCNFWRAITHDPEAVAHYADWPQNENDLHARHAWLKPRRAELSRRLEGDPEYFDPKIAGWWVWGLCLWIGGGWCDEKIKGPWVIENGLLIKKKKVDGQWRSMPCLSGNQGINTTKRQVPNIASGGKGVHNQNITRKRPNLGGTSKGIHKLSLQEYDDDERISRKRPNLGSDGRGLGVNRQRFQIDTEGRGLANKNLIDWFSALSDRLRAVRVCCGDWTRILGKSPTTQLGTTAVFLDPPYSADANRDDRCYAEDCTQIAHEVREWAIQNGDNPKLRIALCGYEGEHDMPDDWETFAWRAGNSYGNANKSGNNARERIYFSPHCLKPQYEQISLF